MSVCGVFVRLTCSLTTLSEQQFSWPYLEQALSLGQSVALHGPEVDVRLSAGHNEVCIHGMKHSGQHRVVGALQRHEA